MERIFNNVSIIFSVCVTAAFAYGIYEAFSYAYLAKIFPLYISMILFILSVINLIQEVSMVSTGKKSEGGARADLESKWDIPMTEVWKRAAFYMTLILILYLCIWLIGYPMSITLFIILFYRYITKTGWIGACIAGGFGLGFLALVSKLLYMDWPEGLIKLPWPLG